MQISFSEYTIVEKTTQAVDPLGLMRPANALRDALFPQFTVLTRHPAYLGLLCAIWQELDTSADAKAPQRARRFRELEVFWGAACAAAGERPVNITKFSRLIERGLPLSLSVIPRQDAVFRRLGYGTLGHYNRPAVSWGLLRRGSEGLTPLGRQLGDGFGARASGGGVSALFKRWRHGQEFHEAGLLQIASKFGLHAPASLPERAAWKEAIEKHLLASPDRRVLWDRPVETDVLTGADESPESLRVFWEHLQDRYPSLQPLLLRIDCFERLTAGLQFLFDCLLARAEFSGEAAQFEVRKDLVPALLNLARGYRAMLGAEDAGQLIARVSEAPLDLVAINDCVLEHHIAHHRQKGARPFLTHDGVQVRGRTDRRQLAGALDGLAKAANANAALDALQFRYRRDWHFAKCRRWKDHADGRLEAA